MELKRVWSRVNQAWFVMLGDDLVLRVVNTKDEADAIIAECNAAREEAQR